VVRVTRYGSARLDGKPASPAYFSRRVLHKCLGYAVRKKRLAANPLSKANLPEGWTAPAKPDDTLDPRAVGSPELVATMLTACCTIGRRQGSRFTAFYGCMFYALMRPSEVAALTKTGCHLPEQGRGHLTFANSSPAAGRAYTDDGAVHEHRGLKGRTKGRPTARRPARKVPIPPQLVTLLRGHTQAYCTAPRRPPVPLRTRHPAPALYLVPGLAESPSRLPHPRTARLTAALTCQFGFSRGGIGVRAGTGALL
jgi:hypothetical protein